jgi:hypothetical protein
MTITQAFVATLLIAAALSTAALFAIYRPLRAQLHAICPSDATADFWMRGTVALFYLVPLWATLAFSTRYARVWTETNDAVAVRALPLDPIGIARDAFVTAAFALIVMLVAMGLRLSTAVNRSTSHYRD